MYIFDTRMLVVLMLALYGLGAVVSLATFKKHKLSNILSNILSSIASLTGILLSVNFLLVDVGRTSIGNISSPIPYISFSITLDRLSAFFILALSLLTLCVSIYSIGYISHYYNKRNVGLFNFLYNLFVLSMILVLTSSTLVLFLMAWEVMSLVSYFLVVFEGEKEETRKAGTLYLIITHIATAFLFIAFALMYRYTGTVEIATIQNASPLIKNILFICLLIGFGTKAGIIPLHVWLPYAHPAAPSNVSALMSGIMIKTAIYGLIRFVLGILGAEYQWWGIAILVIGAVSTVLGVAYALMEHNIKRLLAYHSIENIGIILIGTGIAFFAYSKGNVVLFILSLAAALFHLLNHTIFKGALFLGAGAIHYSTGTKDIEKLGGLLKRLPFTGLFFLIASLSISAIPPFNGFVSEWITYQSLFMGLNVSDGIIKLVALLSVAALAMAGALAATCFVKAFGISFLGLARSDEAKEAKEVPSSMLVGMGILSTFCLIFGIFPSLVIKLLDTVCYDFPKLMLMSYRFSLLDNMQGASSFIYYPLVIDKNSISPLAVAITGLAVIIGVIAVVKLVGRGTQERQYGTWDCGYPQLTPRMQYTATGFSKPIRIVFRGLYKPSRELKVEEGTSPYYPKSMKYVMSTQSVFEKYLYHPVVNFFTNFSRRMRLTVQTGSVHAYLIYIFLTVVVMLIYYGVN